MKLELEKYSLIQQIMLANAEEFKLIRQAVETTFSKKEDLNDFELRKLEIGLSQMKNGQVKSSEAVKAGARKALGL